MDSITLEIRSPTVDLLYHFSSTTATSSSSWDKYVSRKIIKDEE